ncbi:MAG: hypothetical protein EXS08_14170 [Planctomycetes bacterium]|nr:hypothetical protein [Planctomycetota bacterium]
MLTTLVLAFLTSFPQPTFTQEKPATTQSASLSAERRELAEIQLLLGADRKYSEAKERLAVLKEKLAKRTDADAKDLLAEVERLDQSVRRALGEAVSAAANLGEDKVDEAVLAAIQREDFAFVSQLGKRAVPGLLRAVRENADAFPSDEGKDSLLVLSNIDPLAASRLAGELLGENGFFWKKRVTRLLDPPLQDQPGLWTAGSPQQWLGEGLSKTAEKLVDDADVGIVALRFLGELASRGWPSSTFQPALISALRSDDGVRRKGARDVSRSYASTVGVSVYRALLAESDTDLREHAARALAEVFPEDRSLLAKADDPSREVRSFVMSRLERSDKETWHVEERAALTHLLQDEDARIRARARGALWNLPTEEHSVTFDAREWFSDQEVKSKRMVFRAPLADEVYLGLLKGPVDERHGLVAKATQLPLPLCFQMLEALAREPQARLVEEFDGADVPSLEDPEAALRVASSLLENKDLTSRRPLRSLLSQMWSTRSSLSALLRWLLQRNDDALADDLFQGHSRQPSYIARLEPELVGEVFKRYFVALRSQLITAVEAEEMKVSPELAKALLGLANDAAAPLQLRVLALRASLQFVEVGDVHRQAALALLKASAWRDWAASRDAAGALDKLLGRRGAGLANAVILAVLRDPALPEELPGLIADELVPDEDGAAEIVKLTIAHWPGNECWYPAAGKALWVMGHVPALQDAEFLARGVRDPRLVPQAFEALGVLGDARYLPLLSELVAKPASTKELERAAQALVGYLDEGAVEPLLAAAAKVQNGELRDRVLTHLEKIREYLDSKDRWATRKVKAQTREQVIAELVAQLAAKSDEVKVQAIRALATWDAVETMPKLIELTTSGSKSVAAAAREALERLNAPKKD